MEERKLKNELIESVVDNNTLKGRPDWVIALVAIAWGLGKADDIVKQVKPMIQPFIDKWQEDRMTQKAPAQGCYLESASQLHEIEVQPEFSLA